MSTHQHTPVAVVGGAQTGLAVSYDLRQRGIEHVVLDASARAGDPWRRRWDSLRLFTPRRVDHLDGVPLPGRGPAPTKDEFADYLDAYERQFDLPVRHGVRVERLGREDGRFRLETTRGTVTADAVVVAMSSHQVPAVPSMAADLDPTVLSLHSSQYRNPEQLRAGDVLVVGVGNSGAEISAEVAATHRTWLAGEDGGQFPVNVDGALATHVLSRLAAFAAAHVLTTGTPMGRRARTTFLTGTAPLMRTRRGDIERAGIHRVPRITEIRDGKPVAADGAVLDVENVIWSTGYRTGLEDWVDLPVLDEHGMPRHDAGAALDQPGLYFVGQVFLHTPASDTVPGMVRDARRVVEAIARAQGESGAGAGAADAVAPVVPPRAGARSLP
jgi:putative flavoprotein involved in K+ transport